MIDSVCRTGKNYCLLVFLEECKYVVNKIKISKHVTDYLEISSADFDEENSDEETSV